MVHRFFRNLMFLGIFLTLMGCAARQAGREQPTFKAVDLNRLVQSGDYVQKIDHFLVILDASGTTKGAKYQTARHLVKNMNLTIPRLDLKAGLRVFGKDGDRTDLVYGMANYTQSGFDTAIPAKGGYGQSPLGESIVAAGSDLKQASGNIALIIFSDGLETGISSIDAAEGLKKQYGNKLCIYAVKLGSSSRGKVVLEGVTRAGQCGLAVNAEEIQSPEGMAGFVERVFLAKAPPKPIVLSPPPVPPPPPEPKEIPKPEPAAAPPKPLDSDGDGVPDRVDKCPNTPRGAKVDREGCWELPVLYFDTAKWDIKDEFIPSLQEVAAVLKNNPDVKMIVEGYTDNRDSKSYNRRLSTKRAMEVQRYFIQSGVARERLTPWGYGEAKPVLPNTSKENMSRNRRVELLPVK